MSQPHDGHGPSGHAHPAAVPSRPTVKDPVCGMDVTPGDAAWAAPSTRDRFLGFCVPRGCDKLVADLRRYIALPGFAPWRGAAAAVEPSQRCGRRGGGGRRGHMAAVRHGFLREHALTTAKSRLDRATPRGGVSRASGSRRAVVMSPGQTRVYWVRASKGCRPSRWPSRRSSLGSSIAKNVLSGTTSPSTNILSNASGRIITSRHLHTGPPGNEYYHVAFRKKIYTSLDALQGGLDAWLTECDETRPHQGRWCYGKTPVQTFLDSARWRRRSCWWRETLRAPGHGSARALPVRSSRSFYT